MAKKKPLSAAADKEKDLQLIRSQLEDADASADPLKRPSVRVNVRVPGVLHKDFKRRCVDVDIKHQYLLLAAIDLFLSDEDVSASLLAKARQLQPD